MRRMYKVKSCLIKFGKPEHILSLKETGLLYMNNLPYFRKIEDEELRGDLNEGVDELAHGTKGHVVIHGDANTPDRKISVSDFSLRIGPDEPEKINLFCMYALRPDSETFQIDERNYRFGDCALVVLDSNAFMDRLRASLRNNKTEGKADLVEYIDNRHTGSVGPFWKIHKFNYQSEWRLVCSNGPGKERTLTIGPLEDISVIIECSKLHDEIQMCT